MSTGDYPRGKKYNCPDCTMENLPSDISPPINFCAYCNKSGSMFYEKLREYNYCNYNCDKCMRGGYCPKYDKSKEYYLGNKK
jgi:hypothetical protein